MLDAERAGARIIIDDGGCWRVCRSASALVSSWCDLLFHCKQLYFVWNIGTLSQFGRRPGESEIADFNRAITADQDIGRLEVPVHYIRRMNVVN